MNRRNIKEIKMHIRNEYKAKRKEIPDSVKKEMDHEVCKRFLALNSYRYADTVLLYSPLKYEIDTSYIMKDALSKGKRVAYPRCIDGNKMVFHLITSEDQLVCGMYNIREPKEELPIYENGKDNSICIMPGIVFDKRGYRLGYGKGYYDRFLSNFKGIKAGFVYSDFMINELPNGRYDLKADIIITERGVISFAKN